MEVVVELDDDESIASPLLVGLTAADDDDDDAADCECIAAAFVRQQHSSGDSAKSNLTSMAAMLEGALPLLLGFCGYCVACCQACCI